MLQSCSIFTAIWIISDDKHLKILLNDWLSIHGWQVDAISQFDRFQIITGDEPVMILLDSRIGAKNWTECVVRIRALDGPAAAVPIILLAAEEARSTAGLAGCLLLPLDREKTLAMIEQWCGPLDDHDFRSLSNPHYRLTRLSGRAIADDLLARFADQLDAAMDYLDHPDQGASIPHQIAGLAGMIGYDALGQKWRAIDDGDAVDHDVLRREMAETIQQIRTKISAG